MYQCLASDYDKLSKRIKSISKQIATYGYEAHFEELGREVKRVPVYKIDPLTSSKVYQYDIPMEVVNYDFYMPDFKVNNYSPIAVIHHSVIEGSNIKNKIDWIDEAFKDIPECQAWYNIDGHCDDCNDKYLRVKTIMMLNMETGEFRQIGMTCFKKYMGINSYNVIHNFMTVNEIIDEEPACYYTDGESSPRFSYVNTLSYLAHTIDLVNDYGIVKDGPDNTKNNAFELARQGEFASKEAVDKAREIINFFKNVEINDVFGFDKDIKTCISTEYTRADGRFAYVLARYNELTEKQEKHNNQVRNSEYIGNIGDKKVVFKFILDNTFTFENDYGYSTMYIMRQFGTENIVIWTTTTTPSIKIGDVFKASVTIKGHKEYKGVRQTVVTRLKKVDN